MARSTREKSRTGIYHVVLRGNNQESIFYDNEDRRQFIEKVLKVKRTSKFKLFAYCLLNDHVHILIQDYNNLSRTIQRITISYALWFNRKHDRSGRVFQDRFLSEPVEDDAYMLNVLRLIHQNPVLEKQVDTPGDYFWSSYNLYINAFKKIKLYIDPDPILAHFKDKKSFVKFMNSSIDSQCLEHNKSDKISDSALLSIIQNKIPYYNRIETSTDEFKDIIKYIYDKYNPSISQLSRIFGVSRTTIEKSIK